MRRVLLVLASPGWGGTEKAFVELANQLARRCEVTVLVPSNAQFVDRFSDDVHSICALRDGSRRNPLVLLHLYRLIRELRPDIVHTHAAKASEMVYWVGRFRDVNHVATKHNSRTRRVFGWVRWVTAVSEQARATIDNPNGASVVYNGMEPRTVAAQPKPDGFTVLAVGRLHQHKGFDQLVRAVRRLPVEFVVEIAGEGPERKNLEALIDQLDLQDRVSLLGHREDVPELLARAHVQIVTSRTEGFSLALLEGLHYCDVVISTRVGIAPEVLPEELLFEAYEIVDKITEVRERYDWFTARFGQVRAHNEGRFLLASTAERYHDLYGHVLADACSEDIQPNSRRSASARRS